MNKKEIGSILKLTVFALVGYSGANAVSRIPALGTAVASVPGAGNVIGSGAVLGASVVFGKKVKDPHFRLGLQAGAGLSTLRSLFKMPAVSKMLPPPVASFLDGDGGAITVGSDEIEQIVESEIQRRIQASLPEGVTIVGEAVTVGSSNSEPDAVEQEEILEGDFLEDYELNGEEILH